MPRRAILQLLAGAQIDTAAQGDDGARLRVLTHTVSRTSSFYRHSYMISYRKTAAAALWAVRDILLPAMGRTPQGLVALC